jgi:hypothetical protein
MPMATTILPSTTIGTPASSGITPGMESRRRLAPLWVMESCKALVERLKLLAVTAWVMSMLACVSSILEKAASCPDLSTTAIASG